MRYLSLLIICLFLAAAGNAADAPRVVKLIPLHLDAQGRHTLSPSLFERDAYQAQLRKNPKQRAGLRFEVLCKGVRSTTAPVRLRLELRGSGLNQPFVIEQEVETRGWLGTWTTVTLAEEHFRLLGELTAWRATLRQNDREVSELKSFLW